LFADCVDQCGLTGVVGDGGKGKERQPIRSQRRSYPGLVVEATHKWELWMVGIGGQTINGRVADGTSALHLPSTLSRYPSSVHNSLTSHALALCEFCKCDLYGAQFCRSSMPARNDWTRLTGHANVGMCGLVCPPPAVFYACHRGTLRRVHSTPDLIGFSRHGLASRQPALPDNVIKGPS
jgi:hypothetical protein